MDARGTLVSWFESNLAKETGVFERAQVDGRFRKVQAGVLVLLLRQRGRVRAPREEAVVFFFFRYFARETTMSTPGHITITRGSNGPSTRVPQVMLNTSFGSHVYSRVCASFAVLGTVGQSLLSTLLKLDVRIQGPLLVCAVVLILWCKSSSFLHAVVGLQASPSFSAVGALSPSR